MGKAITIVIPTYNMEQYLRRCLDSLIVNEEIMHQMEVLVINDGSKDSSSEIAHEYESRFPHTFKVIDKENGNYGSCVNRGIDNATGKYFRILDADDYFDRQSLTQLVERINSFEQEPDLIITNYQEDYSNGYSTCIFNDIYEYGAILNFDNIVLDKNKSGYLNTMHCMTYKLDVVRNTNLRHTEGISYTDTEYCFYPLRGVKSIMFLDLVLYHYQIGRYGQTVSIASYQKNIHSLYIIIDRMLNSFSEGEEHESYYNNLLNVLKKILTVYYKIILTTKFAHDEQIDNLDSRIREFDNNLYTYLSSIKYSQIIPYVSLWRKGYKTNNCLMTLIYRFVDTLVFIFRKIKRFFVH